MAHLHEKNTYCWYCKKPTDTILDDDGETKCLDCNAKKTLHSLTKGRSHEIYGLFVMLVLIAFMVVGVFFTIYWLVSLFL